ncbi:AI-2E family transporter [[Haemophilus] felis]|nr:AI-2E family transporter [[Haemophilus] felis]NBI42527.1 AI-2E family transporter [[Haemophilus] felis]
MLQNNPILKTLLVCAALVIILAGVKSAVEIVVPFLLALFIAIICSPLVKFMTKRKIPLWLAISILLALILVIFFSFLGLINSTVKEFTASIPEYRLLLADRVNAFLAFAHKWNIPITISRESIMQHTDPSIVMDLISSTLLGFSGVVTNIFVLMLVVILMLFEAPAAKYKLALFFAEKDSDPKNDNSDEHQVLHIDRILQGVIDYLGIKTLMSVITGICIYFLLIAVDVQYAILWATVGFLLNYIPNIGSIITAIPIIVQALLLNGLGVGIGVGVGILIINTVVGNILEPKVMGRTLGLSTLVVFLSLLFWGWLLGSVGMLLSVPLTMALKIILEANPRTQKYAALLDDVDNVKLKTQS